MFSDFLPLLLAAIGALALYAWLVTKVLQKAGYSKWWAITAILPYAGLIMTWVFALSNWPCLQRKDENA